MYTREYCSNNKAVNESFGADTPKDVENVKLLSVKWLVNLRKAELRKNSCVAELDEKEKLLKQGADIYDPLELVAPVTIALKIIM